MTFFQSKKHPHLTMNKWGLVFAPNGHPDGVDYYGENFTVVPLRNGLLQLQYDVQDEAKEAGYTKHYLGNAEILYRKPTTIV
jgi:hypothetical protein